MSRIDVFTFTYLLPSVLRELNRKKTILELKKAGVLSKIYNLTDLYRNRSIVKKHKNSSPFYWPFSLRNVFEYLCLTETMLK